jgi:hypothetical protein
MAVRLLASLCGAVLIAQAQPAQATAAAEAVALGAVAERAPAVAMAEGEHRRALMLALIARRAIDDPALADAAHGVFAADAALTALFARYLGRLRGEEVAATDREIARALELLDASRPQAPLELAALELRLTELLGGWAPLAGAEAPVEPARSALRRRLIQTGDLVPGAHGQGNPARELQVALKRFQSRHGLVADGVIGSRTRRALEVPLAERLRQVELNLARAALLADRGGLPRYVEVNVPGHELRLVEQDAVRLVSRVIVGDRETATPIFDDVIRRIEFNPSWYVPRSIVPEVLKKEAESPGYLERNGFVVREGEDGRVRMHQRPGPTNALGRMKFLFPNHHAVYLHDTAQRELFGRHDQSLSHGCVRVERPYELAVALLAAEGWTEAMIDAVLERPRTRVVELGQPVPVFLDYRTAFLDEQGRLQLREDLYGHDAAGIVHFPEKALGRSLLVAERR